MTYDWGSLAIVAGIGLPVVALEIWGMVASGRRVDGWAGGRGMSVVSRRRRLSLARGPFNHASSLDIVYRLTVRDARGLERSGWARVSWMARFVAPSLGPIEVQWDEAKGSR